MESIHRFSCVSFISGAPGDILSVWKALFTSFLRAGVLASCPFFLLHFVDLVGSEMGGACFLHLPLHLGLWSHLSNLRANGVPVS